MNIQLSWIHWFINAYDSKGLNSVTNNPYVSKARWDEFRKDSLVLTL